MKSIFYNFVLCFALLMLFTGNLWGPLETSEARYAEISREMYESGDWLHPALLNIKHYHKPPVTYWITAAAYKLFGVNFFAFRFFLVVAWVIQCVLMVKIARLLFEDDETAWLSGCIFGTFPLVLAASRGLTTDMYLLTFILAAVFSWIKFVRTGGVLWLYAFMAFLGLGFLTKGPVALLLPSAVVISLLRWRKIPDTPFLHRAGALLAFLVLGFGWFILLVTENVRLLDYFFFRHFVDRVADASVFSRSKPFYYYLAMLPALALPWLVPLISKARLTFKNPGNTVIRHLLIYWFLLPLLVFSAASSKLPLYILPLFPALSLYLAFVMKEYRHLPAVRLGMLITNLIIFSAVGPGHVLFMKPFNVFLTISGLFFLLCSVVVYMVSGLKEKSVLQSIIFGTGLLTTSTVYLHTADTSDIDTRNLAAAIQDKQVQNAKIFVFDEILPSLAFHLGKVPVSVYNGNKNLKRETEFEVNDNWKSYLIDLTGVPGKEQLKKELQKRVFLVCRKDKLGDVRPFLPDEFSTETIGNRILILTGQHAHNF